MGIVGSSIHMRSFLDKPTAAGHTIKGSGLVSYASSRKNSTTAPLTINLHRACDRNLMSYGVLPSDYNYGRVTILDVTAIVSFNGRRSERCGIL
jgi:hypothetical protein